VASGIFFSLVAILTRFTEKFKLRETGIQLLKDAESAK